MNRESITVTALNKYVRSLLETDEVLSQIWVEGEISGFKLHTPSGHMYFRLIDSHCSVKCVMFRFDASKLQFLPKDGMKVLVNCRVSLYEASGDFQLYVKDIVEKGAGIRKQQLDILKEKLSKQGLFDASRKKNIPINPKRIGVITSESGAAIKDIVKVMGQRDPFVEIILYPVNVQGVFAVDAICESIDNINSSYNKLDLVIITRGGGSKDDLWIFNEEKLVLAAAKLKIPFISAVGHEIDITLLDLIADHRSPTPTAAAQDAVPDMNYLFSNRIAEVYELKEYLSFYLDKQKQSLNTNLASLQEIILRDLTDKKREINNLEKTCETLSPLQVLNRGYSIAMKNHVIVNSVDNVNTNDDLSLLVSDGIIRCTVKGIVKHEI